ncbi:glycosyltransferase family 1 protein [Hyphomicrobiales bacterium 4NK60-0047b]
MRILIATDAWVPQVNGVVRTYQRLEEELVKLGHEVCFITPSDFFTVPCPTYPEIRLSFVRAKNIANLMKKFKPDAVHVATEGPIGWSTRRFCLKRGLSFTTSYHTRFPEYVTERVPLPLSFIYKFVRTFHNAGDGIMVATKSLQNELSLRGFRPLRTWTRGVNTDMFRPRCCRIFGEKQVALYVGRVAPEKNLDAFLKLDLDVNKVVVGDGPYLKYLQKTYKDVIFTGAKEGEDLAECYSSGDVFVFPSKTDTFGIVLLEAMASGVPVAAYPVTGPIDVVEDGVTGCLDENLEVALLGALKLDRDICRDKALEFSWQRCAELFLCNLKLNNGASQSIDLPERVVG